MKTLFFSLLVLFCIIQKSYAQIPVTDAAMNANTVSNQIMNGATWTNQLFELEEQASVLDKTLKFVTNVSSAVRDLAYAKSLIERQKSIVKNCQDILKRSEKVDLKLARNLNETVSSFLYTNSSLVDLLTSTLTTKFKMNDSERLKTLLDIKSEQEKLSQSLRMTNMILSTTQATDDIINYQLLPKSKK